MHPFILPFQSENIPETLLAQFVSILPIHLEPFDAFPLKSKSKHDEICKEHFLDQARLLCSAFEEHFRFFLRAC